MIFRSRTEAYIYAIYMLESILEQDSSIKNELASAIASIKVCIENHEANPEKVSALIDSVKPNTLEDRVKLRILSAALKEATSYRKLNAAEKSYLPLARRLESELHIELLLNPTEKMMSVIQVMSQKILHFFYSLNEDQNKGFLKSLLDYSKQPISFGAFEKEVTKESIISLLETNSRAHLTEILFVHLYFHNHVARNPSIVGECAHIAKKISNEKMYKSSYYKDRGRKGPLVDFRTSQMGLETHIIHAHFFNRGLPLHTSHWIADAKSQKPDLDSHYVRRLGEHDTPYVAGPSGLTSVFMGGMYGLNVFSTLDEKRLYILGFASYIVAGGFHSLHEVLGPIAYCLPEENLIEGYATCIPDEKTDIPSPCYNTFYSLIANIDDEFSLRRDNAWQKMLSFFKERYLTSYFSSYSYNKLNEKNRILEAIQVHDVLVRNEIFPSATSCLPTINIYKGMIASAENKRDLLAFIDHFLNDVNLPVLHDLIAKYMGFESVGLLTAYISKMQDCTFYDSLPMSSRNLSLLS